MTYKSCNKLIFGITNNFFLSFLSLVTRVRNTRVTSWYQSLIESGHGGRYEIENHGGESEEDTGGGGKFRQDAGRSTTVDYGIEDFNGQIPGSGNKTVGAIDGHDVGIREGASAAQHRDQLVFNTSEYG